MKFRIPYTRIEVKVAGHVPLSHSRDADGNRRNDAPWHDRLTRGALSPMKVGFKRLPPRNAAPRSTSGTPGNPDASTSNALAGKAVLRDAALRPGKEDRIAANLASRQAPVRRLDDKAFSRAVAQLTADVAAWRKPESNFEGMHDWKVRLDDTKSTLLIGDPSDINAGFFVGGQPRGLITLARQDDHLEVEMFVTHPGTQGVGSTLLELAVNLSQEAGFAGKLALGATHGSVPAYSALGFRSGPLATDMRLEPATRPDLWSRTGDGRWQLTKHAQDIFATALRESAPPL